MSQRVPAGRGAPGRSLLAHRVIRALCTCALVVGAFPILSPVLRAQEATPEFRTGAEVVVLDVVVRDHKGNTVRDLRPEEIRLFEDGVAQELVSFRLRAAGRGTAGDAPESGPRGPAETDPGESRAEEGGPSDEDARHVNLVTLVFDQLGPDGRRIAREAGLALAGITDREDLLVSVFKIRESLGLVQQFTADRARVREAVIEATGALSTHYSAATDELVDAVERDRIAQERLDALGEVAGAAQASQAAALGQQADLARMAVDALRLTQTLQREQQGSASLYALLALSRQQQRLAGRKTILYFSEGLQVPSSLEHVLRQAISEANQANVSIYTIDARGLTVEPRMDVTRETLRQSRVALERQANRRGVGPVSKEEVLALDTAENALRMDVQGTLTDLAHGTGGTLIADTNRVGPAIERAVGDMRGYYELVYAPTNPAYDGTFRKVKVEVTRPGVRVQSRSGYFALPPGEGTADFAYEVDLLRALRRHPLPTDLALRASPFRFGPEPGGIRHTLVLEVPLSGLTFESDDRGDTDQVHLSILAQLRDPTGLVIEKFTEDSPVFLPRQQRAALRQGNAVFLRSFVLAPGRYTLELAVVDRLAHHYTASRSVLDVPTPVPGLVASEIALIKREESVPSGVLDSPDPFRQGQTRLVPWLAEPSLGPEDSLSLFLVAYPSAGEDAVALLEFVRDGHVVEQTLTPLPPPDAAGRSPFVAAVPTGELAAGSYEVRVLLKQGGLVAQRKAHFVLNRAGG
jgi:VWFA-related protein